MPSPSESTGAERPVIDNSGQGESPVSLGLLINPGLFPSPVKVAVPFRVSEMIRLSTSSR